MSCIRPHNRRPSLALATGVAIGLVSAAGLMGFEVSVASDQPDSARAQIPDLYRLPVAEWPAPEVDEGVAWKELSPRPEPPSAPDEAVIALGQWLFFDPRLSGSGQVACASCHDPQLGWADGRRVPFGHQRFPGIRNAPTVLDMAFQDVFFWDGRADSLEAQAIEAILNPEEMNHTAEGVRAALSGDQALRAEFESALGDPEPTLAAVAEALAAFQRSLVSPRGRFDRFLAGDHDALTDAEIRGLHWFRTQARCMNCHHGAMFSDGEFHNLGLSFYGRRLEDLGRYDITGEPEDVGRFRTPTLRSAVMTAPYMHMGLMPTLRHVVIFYNAGGGRARPRGDQQDDPLFPSTSPLLQPLGLDAEQQAELVAFLETLSGRLQRPRRQLDIEDRLRVIAD